MEQTQWIKQMVAFQKGMFENSFNAMDMARTNTEKVVNSMMEQATWIPEPVKQACSQWNRSVNEGCKNFKQMVDDNFHKMEALFSDKE